MGGKLVPAEEPSHLKAKSDNKYFGEEARANFFKLYQKVRFGVESLAHEPHTQRTKPSFTLCHVFTPSFTPCERYQDTSTVNIH